MSRFDEEMLKILPPAISEQDPFLTAIGATTPQNKQTGEEEKKNPPVLFVSADFFKENQDQESEASTPDSHTFPGYIGATFDPLSESDWTQPFPRDTSMVSKASVLTSPASPPASLASPISPAKSTGSTESTRYFRMFSAGECTVAPVSERLGAGGQGFVDMAGILSRDNNDPIGWAAVKITSPDKEKQARAIEESKNHQFLTGGRGSLRTGLLAWMAQITRDGNGIVMPLCSMTLKEFNEDWLSAADDHTRHCVMYSVLLSILRALRTLQEKGAVHNDIKDENCMLRESGDVFGWVLTDFGTVCAAASTSANLPVFSPARTGGTACYIAPEVVGGETPAFHSDVFSAGETLRRLLNVAFTIPFVNGDAIVSLFQAGIAYAAAREESFFQSACFYQSEILANTRLARTFDDHYERLTAFMCSILPEKRPTIETLERVVNDMLHYLPSNHHDIAQAFYRSMFTPSQTADASSADNGADEGLSDDHLTRMSSAYSEVESRAAFLGETSEIKAPSFRP